MTETRGESPDGLAEAMARLKDVVAERQRAKPGSRKHRGLLEEEERLITRVTTLHRLRP